MKNLILAILSLFVLNSWAADLTKEMDALGANKDLMRKAKAIDPQNRVRVVQNRDVDRYMRFEVGLNMGMAEGGDPYINTNVLGGELDFHITPRWSLGARYYNASNTMSSEGKRVFDDARTRKQTDPNFRIPDTDPAKDEWLAVANWYPIYGKMNLFDVGVSQFDLYFLLGAGQINLSSGTAPLYTAGGGAGIWLTQHFATRLEARWQGYEDQVGGGSRKIDQTMLTLNIGFLL